MTIEILDDDPRQVDDESLAAESWNADASPSRVTEVYNQILARMVRGELPGGSELKSTRLAAELGVSRTPVVQALARLLADGVVTQKMNMRAIVTPGAENWLVEIHELRVLLEPAAAARAAEHMPAAVIAQLSKQAAAAAPDDSADWPERARDFDFALHQAIADYSGNQPLRGAIYKCWEYKRLSYELGVDRHAAILRGYHEHVSILAAIEARDAPTAAAAMELHLRQASAARPQKESGVTGMFAASSDGGHDGGHDDAPIFAHGMIGMGMIFDETYRPLFEAAARRPLYDPQFGVCRVTLSAAATRTGARAEAYRSRAESAAPSLASFHGAEAVGELLRSGVDVVCIATPDDRHFAAARASIAAGKHVLVEKPSVLNLAELDELVRLAREHKVLAKVVYHKLLDPDHKRLRTLVADGVLAHVNNGYCSLLEPKSIASGQFAEWITGRNPGTYVAVHYIKLIDFTFGLRLVRVACTGQRGLVGPANGPTWDSTQLRLVYEHADGREAAFDIHTSWVTPNNFPGFVEQEVQFRFDNGVWNGHSRKRGVECTVEGRTPVELKSTMNNHYNAAALEPWGERTQRGYGVEVIDRFMREAAAVEFGGPASERDGRLAAAQGLTYNDLRADRQVVAAVQAMEAILARHAAGAPDAVVHVNGPDGGLVLHEAGSGKTEVLYEPKV